MKALVVRYSAIGDCVMAAHAVSALRRRHPDWHIAWAVDADVAPVIETEWLVNQRIDVPRREWKRRKASAFEQIRYYLNLRQHQFDYGFDLQGHSKTGVCLRLSGAKKRWSIGYTDPFARLLNPSMPFDRSRHLVEQFHEFLENCVGVAKDLSPIMPQLPPPVLDSKRLITIHTGAGAVWKQWPLERWVQVAAGLKERGFTVAFLGGPGDPSPADAEHNFVDQLSLVESMAMTAGSSYHLSGDTGSGHVAAAYGVPVVTLFGRTDPTKTGPYTEKKRFLRKGDATDQISVDEVLCAFDELEAMWPSGS
ncbi:MAG TPA: glycosyltransferase family 9 protein [Fimbriimonadaceae bacterium]|nr:glycosyltransferase family 9 protein [Fimbriimonadaceae bacterium]